MRRVVAYGPAMVVLVTSLVVLMAAPAAVRRIHYATVETRLELARQVLDDDDILEKINAAVRNVAVAVQPSLVHIEARRRVSELRRVGSTGSGCVSDGRGHVITNAHVVRDASEFFVAFSDGRVVEAELVGKDPYTDIAVLRVNVSSGLFPMRRASGDRVSQGDRVFAFGSPFGFKFSMSEGIISGLGRNPDTAVELGGYTNFIQSDAAVNPGNSGGPLTDIRGRVIGMNVAIATGADSRGTVEGQYAGISFAIPLSTIESVVPQLIETGRVSRGYLGVNYFPSNNLDGSRGMVRIGSGPYPVGLRLDDVVEDAPAARAGIQPGDVLVEIRGRRVVNYDVLRSMIGSARPGEVLPVKVWRDQEIIPLDVQLAEFPPPLLAQQQLARYGFFQIDEVDGQIMLGQVGMPAYQAGFRPGQRILSVGSTPVSTLDEMFEAMVQENLLDGETVTVEVRNPGEDDGPTTTLEIRLAR